MFSLFPVTCESWFTVRDWGARNNMLWMRGQVLLVLPCVQLPALAVVTQHNGNKWHKWLLAMVANVRTDIQSSYSQYLLVLKISYKVWILLGDPQRCVNWLWKIMLNKKARLCGLLHISLGQSYNKTPVSALREKLKRNLRKHVSIFHSGQIVWRE